jgi:hypothetical protein
MEKQPVSIDVPVDAKLPFSEPPSRSVLHEIVNIATNEVAYRSKSAHWLALLCLWLCMRLGARERRNHALFTADLVIGIPGHQCKRAFTHMHSVCPHKTQPRRVLTDIWRWSKKNSEGWNRHTYAWALMAEHEYYYTKIPELIEEVT